MTTQYVESFAWTGFSILEWGPHGPFLSIEDIKEIQNILTIWETGPSWFRLPDKQEWVQWDFRAVIGEKTRLHLHTKIHDILKKDESREDILIRWVGTRTRTSYVYTLNEHVQWG